MAPKRKLSRLNSGIPLSISSSSPFSNSSPASQGDEEVTMSVKISKTVSLKVKGSDTVEKIRKLIKQREDAVPACFQELIISGNQLKDGERVSDYVTAGNSTINVVCRESRIIINVMRITIDGTETTVLRVKMSDTVESVKSGIDAKEGTRSDEYRLMFDGEPLEDNITVGDYGLKNDSVLYMMFHPSETMPLRIYLPCGKIERITVKPLNTIFDLKVLLQRNEYMRMPINKWHLAYLGETLADCETVAYCRLEDDSLLHVRLPRMQIFVKICSGNQITVFFKQDDYVVSLKEKIFDKSGYPVEHQMLVFSGRVLEDGKKITAYGIQASSTVDLRLKLEAPPRD